MREARDSCGEGMGRERAAAVAEVTGGSHVAVDGHRSLRIGERNPRRWSGRPRSMVGPGNLLE